MAKFALNQVADDDEDEKADQLEDDEEIEPAARSKSEHKRKPKPAPAPRPRMQAQQAPAEEEDEEQNQDQQDADQEQDEDGDAPMQAPATAPPARRGARTNGAVAHATPHRESIRLPQQLGLDAQKLHLMKASLFGSPEIATFAHAGAAPSFRAPASAPSQVPRTALASSALSGARGLGPFSPSDEHLGLPGEDGAELAGAIPVRDDDHDAEMRAADWSAIPESPSVVGLRAAEFATPRVSRPVPPPQHQQQHYSFGGQSQAQIPPRGSELMLKEPDPFALAQQPPLPIVPPADALAQVDAKSQGNPLRDAGLVSRRSFRVSWGPNNTLAFSDGQRSIVTVQQALVDAAQQDARHSEHKRAQRQLTALLKVHLDFYRSENKQQQQSQQQQQSSEDGDVAMTFASPPPFSTPGYSGPPLTTTSSAFSPYSPFTDWATGALSSSSSSSSRPALPPTSRALVRSSSGRAAAGAAGASKSAPLTKLCDAYLSALHELSKARQGDSALHNAMSVWKLVKALWSPELGGASVPNTEGKGSPSAQHADGSNDYAESYARRRNLSKWLAETVAPQIAAELSELASSDRADDDGSLVAKRLFAMLSGNQITEAADHAASSGDLRLATLLSQAGEDLAMQEDIKNQIKSWSRSDLWNLMDKDHQKLYQLLSGETTVDPSLSWLRCFGLQLWFGQPSQNASISRALEVYESSVRGSRAKQPNPPYLAAVDDDEARAQLQSLYSPAHYDDARFGLIKLHCDNMHKLSAVVSPQSWVQSPLDHAVSWHLYDVLQHTSAYELPRLHDLFMNYAAQLETVGLWQWAIYVIMATGRLESQYFFDRERIVKQILHRNTPPTLKISVSADAVVKQTPFALALPDRRRRRSHDRFDLSDLDDNLPRDAYAAQKQLDEIDRFLISDVGVPAKWIHEARATRALYDRVPEVAVLHLLKSEQWDRAHEVFMLELAPQWLLKDLFALVVPILEELDKHNPEITAWKENGGLLLHFIRSLSDARELLETLREPLDEETLKQMLALQAIMRDLLKRIEARSHSDQLLDRVMMSELAVRLSNFLRELDASRFQRLQPPDVKELALTMPSAQVALLSSGMAENDRLAQLDSIADALLAQFSVHDATDSLLARVNRNVDPFADDFRSSSSSAAAAAPPPAAAAAEASDNDNGASGGFSFGASSDQFDFSSANVGGGFSFGGSFDTKMSD